MAAVGAAACQPPKATTAPAAGATATGSTTATLLVRGGTILTMNPDAPQAEAVAVDGDRVVAVGDARELEAWVGKDTEVIDLQGGLAVPGLVDAHAHLVGLGVSLETVDLRGATSVDDVVARLKAGDRGGAWLTGRGWDQNLWAGAAMPTSTALDEAFPGRPVWLRRVDGHAGWASRAALEASGIGKDTTSPPGGEILRGKDRTPTGVLVDAAMGLMKVPAPSEEDVIRYVAQAQAHALERGLTGMHDMGVGPVEDGVYRKLLEPGAASPLVLRVTGYAGESWFSAALTDKDPDVAEPDSRYALVGVKMYADGALGSRGAALLAPYSDRPDHTGLMQHTGDEMRTLSLAAARKGWQMATHAIGDAGNRAVLDAYAAAIPQWAGPEGARFRIEHCQIVAVEDIARFAELGIIASMQPTHATSDMAWVPARIGEARLPGAYAWRRFLEAGVPLAFGSDFPVERVDVTHGLYAAITRQDPEGNPAGGWLADQRLDLTEAIAAFSATAAYAARREDHLGRLQVGYQADVTCFAEDLQSLAPKQVRDAAIAATIVGGQVAHRA